MFPEIPLSFKDLPKVKPSQLFWVQWVTCFVLIWPMALTSGGMQDILSGLVGGIAISGIMNLLYLKQD